MKQGQFEKLYRPQWESLENQLSQLEKNDKNLTLDIDNFTQLYRKVCHYHSLAKERRYSSYLVDHLGELIVRGHQQLYQRKHDVKGGLKRFCIVEFPSLVRKEYRYFWVATFLLYGPGLLFFLGTLFSPELVYTVMGPMQVMQFEEMYNPDNRTLGSARDSETNWQMFGYYIYNNISVSFNTFATGLLWGLGSIFFLVFNGLLIGAAAGHLTNVGYTETFFTFVVGHGSFELTAIVIAGAAGLKLGYSLLAPGNLTRIESLKKASQVAIKLVIGVIIMLTIAAFIEAFWSSNNILLPWQKYSVGAFLWLVVIAYLLLSGKQRGVR